VKSAGSSLLTHLSSEVTSVAMCWKLTTATGTVLGFTSHSTDLVVSGVTYKSAVGFTPTAIQTGAGLNVDNLDVQGVLDALGIVEADVYAGVYDGAEVEVFLVNWANLNHGIMRLRKGFLGNVKIARQGFEAEIRGLLERFQRSIVEVYTPGCRADLGDARCTVDLGAFTETGTITSVTNRRVFADTTRTEADGYFLGGLLTWTSGNNSGLSMEVKQYTLATTQFELMLPMRYTVQVGDGYSVYAGCDKAWETCRDKFNNILNFRGEPFVPQTQDMAVSSIR